MNSSDFRERFYLVEVSYSVDEAGDQIPTKRSSIHLLLRLQIFLLVNTGKRMR